MRSMLVNERLGRITEEQLGDNRQPDVFLAIEGLLQDVTSIAVGGKLNNTSPGRHGQRI